MYQMSDCPHCWWGRRIKVVFYARSLWGALQMSRQIISKGGKAVSSQWQKLGSLHLKTCILPFWTDFTFYEIYIEQKNPDREGWQILKCIQAAGLLSNVGSGHEAGSLKEHATSFARSRCFPEAFAFFWRCFARFTGNLVLASIKWRQQEEVDIF